MEGPYTLDKNEIEKYIFAKPGAYYIVYSKDDKEVVYTVGRSNDNLKQQMFNLLPEEGFEDESKKGFYKVYIEYTPGPRPAYELECQWYHKYTPDATDVHPAKTHPSWICPVCKK